MNAGALRKRLEKTKDKFSIFANKEMLKQYHFNAKEFLDLISDFLSDEEKNRLFDYAHFTNLDPWIKGGIIGSISDENILLQMINNENIMSGLESYQTIALIKRLNDNTKLQLLHNQNFIQKYQIPDYELRNIVSTLSEQAQEKILLDVNFVTNQLHLAGHQIMKLVENLSNDEVKDKVLKIYPLENYQKVLILKTCSNRYKMEAILQEKDFDKFHIISILQTLDRENLSEFLVEQREFCKGKGIAPYEVIQRLDSKRQKEFITNLDNFAFTLSEKREILATLNIDVKESIDTSNFPEEYKSALTIQMTDNGRKIILDLERNLEDYKGLDHLISENPENFTEEQRLKFLKLCDICPNLEIESELNEVIFWGAKAKDYKEAEEWISSVIDNLKPEYSKAQKMAVIDNAIGKKISYSPDFDTEVFNTSDCRALWKIISSGYGVCNGIAKVEQYILRRVGIESKMISSGNHSFLKIKDIELPLASGGVAKGNTILDPTWNLTSHRFGGKPDNFCISYEQARKNDIDEEGKDHYCHKNDEQLQDATLNLDEKSLRNLFTSVGLADKEGQFSIKDLLEKSTLVDIFFARQPEQNINKQFLLLRQACPEFATCQNSSMRILSDILLNNENLRFNKCVVNRVYSRNDKEKRPILYVYVDSNELGKKFYFASQEEGQFVGLSQEEFTEQFECYEEDLKRTNGLRPWEMMEQEKKEVDLSKSSGEIVAKEEAER